MENHNGKPADPPPQQIPIGLLFLIAAVIPVAGLFLAIAANAISYADRGYAWIGPVIMVASLLYGASYIIPFARRANSGESPIAVLGAIFLFIEYPFLALMMLGAHAFRFGIAA